MHYTRIGWITPYHKIAEKCQAVMGGELVLWNTGILKLGAKILDPY
jgi:hypothetical protein